MTLISLTLNHGHPIMMADILISSKQCEGGIKTPTFVDGTKRVLPEDAVYKPLTLRQKLYVINDRLCVAFAGSMSQAKLCLSELKKSFSDVDFNDDELLHFVEKYPKKNSNKLTAIVLKSSKDGDGYVFAARSIGKVSILENERYEKVFADGTGKDQFLKFIDSNPAFDTDITNEDGFLVMNQYLISYWLGREVSRADSLLNHWGAGYEMIIFENGKFVKLDEYTVVLLAGEFGKNVEFDPAPFNTIMVNYQDDLMVIRAFANDVQTIFAVPTILDSGKEFAVRKHEAKHQNLMITYIVVDVDRNVEYFPTVVRPRNVNKKGETPIVFERTEDKLRLYTSRKHDAQVREWLSKIVEFEITG